MNCYLFFLVSVVYNGVSCLTTLCYEMLTFVAYWLADRCDTETIPLADHLKVVQFTQKWSLCKVISV